ncbi:SatD family protein [Terrabacter sp. Ter38]|uniref:SatD family protein n=1 Tax=Terrabacter sp. Ter38 TaxID=2926030 RepID=UPI002118C4F2|nr:SatD family protein [Terrabacter sp. Ter38]
MSDLKAEPSPVALIGDIVESRTHRERQALHDAFEAAVARANAEVPIDDPAVITVGDEFQGVYPTLGAALRASFVVRSELFPRADVRFGLGRGAVTTLDPVRGIHDGPAYWAAREAITAAEDRAQHAQTRTSRTAYVAPDEPAETVAALRAALDCLDFMVGSMSTTSREILGGLMHGHAQHDVADRVGISPSAVSQRVRRDGIGVALEAMTTLGGLP